MNSDFRDEQCSGNMKKGAESYGLIWQRSDGRRFSGEQWSGVNSDPVWTVIPAEWAEAEGGLNSSDTMLEFM